MRPFHGIAVGALVAAATLISSASSAAITLLVNGNTPSVHWQRVVDTAGIPMARGPLNVFLTRCPGVDAAGCTASDGSAIWVGTSAGSLTHAMFRLDLFHELGHVFDFRMLTDADREEFRVLWNRPAISWWTPLRPGPDTGTTGTHSSAGEWFADAFAACAAYRPTWNDDYIATGLRIIPVTFRLRWAEHRLYRTCNLIRAAASRATRQRQ